MHEELLPNPERTAKDLVEDMLAKGRSWIDILAVASAARKGAWRKEVETLLVERKLIPQDKAARESEMQQDLKSQKPELSKYARTPKRKPS